MDAQQHACTSALSPLCVSCPSLISTVAAVAFSDRLATLSHEPFMDLDCQAPVKLPGCVARTVSPPLQVMSLISSWMHRYTKMSQHELRRLEEEYGYPAPHPEDYMVSLLQFYDVLTGIHTQTVTSCVLHSSVTVFHKVVDVKWPLFSILIMHSQYT